jgi:hypothetical protein
MFMIKPALPVCAAILSFAAPASAESTTVVGLFENVGTLNVAAVENLGCTVFHAGKIVAQQASFKMKQPDQFIIMSCEQPLLHDAQNRQALGALYAGGHMIAALEGPLTRFDIVSDRTRPAERQYILKLGYYNNSDIDRREDDLQALNQKVTPLEDHWTTEGFVGVNHAMGIPTPDELVIIYYDTPESGERFRDNNKDILGEVRAFNDAHLTKFSYLVGMEVN